MQYTDYYEVLGVGGGAPPKKFKRPQSNPSPE
jgi:hypothetical protein